MTSHGLNESDVSDRTSVFEHHRGLLFSIAYRMLGSVADAEDALQRLQRPELGESEHARAADVGRTVDRQRQRARFPAAVGVHHDIVGEQREQAVHVAASRGSIETLEQLGVEPAGRAEARTVSAHVLPRAPQQLTTVRFADAEHPGDFRVRVIENFREEKHGALDWTQALEQKEHRHRHRFIHFGDPRHVASRLGDDRLGQPLADVRLPLHASGLADG